MEMTDESLIRVKNTPTATRFLGNLKPTPISANEGERILKQVQEGVERPKPSIVFEIGEQVRVADGPFTSFNGLVEEVDEERAPQGRGVDLRALDAGRAGVLAGREAVREYVCPGRWSG